MLDTRTGLDAGQVIRWKFLAPLDRICLLAYIYLAVTPQRNATQDTGLGCHMCIT